MKKQNPEPKSQEVVIIHSPRLNRETELRLEVNRDIQNRRTPFLRIRHELGNRKDAIRLDFENAAHLYDMLGQAFAAAGKPRNSKDLRVELLSSNEGVLVKTEEEKDRLMNYLAEKMGVKVRPFAFPETDLGMVFYPTTGRMIDLAEALDDHLDGLDDYIIHPLAAFADVL